MDFTIQDLEGVFPRPLMDDERERVQNLINRALELIWMEFARRGRDFDKELKESQWLRIAARHAVVMMVSQAVLVGENIGAASASSTTGPQSDSVTWSQGVGIKWGGVGIDDAILELLGLVDTARPLGHGGIVVPFGKRSVLYGAEFSERGRC